MSLPVPTNEDDALGSLVFSQDVPGEYEFFLDELRYLLKDGCFACSVKVNGSVQVLFNSDVATDEDDQRVIADIINNFEDKVLKEINRSQQVTDVYLYQRRQVIVTVHYDPIARTYVITKYLWQ